MRPGQQQNKQRMRGRGGRKGPNPLSRSFESNGPDVKIRGTAQHIADKYTTLARDAAASGDRVMAENYLQHAEHYGRIVAAAMGQFQPTQPERDFDEFEDDLDEGAETPAQGQGQGERFNGQSFGAGQNERQPRDQQNRDHQPRENRGERNERREFRGERGERNFNRDRNPEGGYNNRDRQNDRQGQAPAGVGPQPFPPREDGEEARGQQAAEPQRFEAQNNRGDRRENRRDRQRFNERSGERRFEERFGRLDDRRHDERPEGAERQPDAQATANEATSPAAPASPAPVAEVRRDAPAPQPAAAPLDVAPAAESVDAGSEARRRPRKRSDAEVMPEAAPVADAAPAAVDAPAEPKRRAARVAAATPAEPDAGAEAAPKRKPGRPRKKKTDDEGGEGGASDLELASNG